MDFLGILLTLALTIGPWIWLWKLNEKVNALEKRHIQHPTEAASIPEEEPVSTFEEQEEAVEVETVVQEKQEIQEIPHVDFQWEKFFGKKFFAIFGSISVTLSLIFFAVWALSNGYLGPLGQVCLGAIVSIGFLVAGEVMRSRGISFFQYLSAVGFAGLIGMTFVARSIYGFLTPDQAFFAFVFEVGVAIFLALRYDSRIIGNAAIVGGLIAPILVQSPNPNPIGLFAFLAVLTVGGFLLSLKGKWPEIMVLLFVGVCGFEIGAFAKDFFTDQPYVFLSFIAGLHMLMGSGGILREIMYREQRDGELAKEVSSTIIVDTILFISSVLLANVFAFAIFKENHWENFGFIVLGEGFLIYFLSAYLQKLKLYILRNIAISGTLISIVFATLWQLKGGDYVFIVTLLLALESVLFGLANRYTKDFVFEVFSKIVNVLAMGWATYASAPGISNFEATLIVGAIIFMQYMSCWGLKNGGYKKVMSVLAIVFASWFFTIWNMGILFEDVLSNAWRWLSFVLFAFWGGGLSYVSYKATDVSRKYLHYLGVSFLLFVNIVAWLAPLLSRGNSDLTTFLILLFTISSSIPVLYWLHLDSEKGNISSSVKKVLTYVLLGICTITIIPYSTEIFKNSLSLFWGVWGLVLLIFGANRKIESFRYAGIGALVLVLAKLYIVDVWQFDEWLRVVAFGLIGVGLLVVSYFYNRTKK